MKESLAGRGRDKKWTKEGYEGRGRKEMNKEK
jgi:hypothetical protein